MRIIRYKNSDSGSTLAAFTDAGNIHPLPHRSFMELVSAAKKRDQSSAEYVRTFVSTVAPLERTLEEVDLLTPLDAPEVWASGVTYQKSREARNFETKEQNGSQTFYDKVYEAQRPEIFFKSTAKRTIGPNQEIYLRSDSRWQIPEPELGLVLSQEGEILGYTIGNDMSCRDIEGENPLYLPQAKIWKHSCVIGPAVLLPESVRDPYGFEITCRIYRDEALVVEGRASTKQLKRTYEELIDYLKRDNELYDGTVLLTGTSIVPPDDFSLAPGDRIDIEISDIGVLSNPVVSINEKATMKGSVKS